MVIGAQHDAGARGGRNHSMGTVERQGQRFLAQHVLSCGDGRQSLRFVPFIGRADVDSVNGRLGKEVARWLAGHYFQRAK